jgi:hypothetical protein
MAETALAAAILRRIASRDEVGRRSSMALIGAGVKSSSNQGGCVATGASILAQALTGGAGGSASATAVSFTFGTTSMTLARWGMLRRRLGRKVKA